MNKSFEITGADAWSHKVSRDDVPEGESLHVRIEADAGVRAALQRAGNLVDLSILTAEFELTRQSAGMLHVAGEVAASLVQKCVVTLEDIQQKILDPVDVTFAPALSLMDKTANALEDEIDLEAEPPEPMIDGSVDLGLLAAEHFLVAIDPYPRKPGVVFEPQIIGSEEPPKAFAALAALKKRS